MEIVIHQTSSGGRAEDVHGALVSLCNAEISKLMAGATLTGESSGPGSYALGKVHETQWHHLVLSDASRLGERFQQDLARPFVAFNPQLRARPPILKIQVVQELDANERMKLYSVAANELGLELDEDQIRQEFGMKRPGNALRVIRGTKAGNGTPEPSQPGEPQTP
jgi:phage gp29-like protein